MADLTPVVEKMAAAKPDMVFAGTQSDDAYSMVNAMVQLGLQPEVPVPVQRRQLAGGVPQQGRRQQRRTASSAAATGSPNSKAPGNQQFIKAYIAKYGGTPTNIDSGSAEAYAVGEVVAEVAKKTGKIDNATIIKTLHSGTWPTVEGNLSWDQYGAPTGSALLTEWIDGKLLPVYPPAQALARPGHPQAAVGRLRPPSVRR